MTNFFNQIVRQKNASRFSCVIAIFSVVVVAEVRSQSNEDLNWRSKAESRLKSIFDRSEFRARNLSAEWLIDSSGFVTREFDRNKNASTLWLHDPQKDEPRAWNSDDRLLEPTTRNLSADRKSQFLHRDHQLLALKKESGEETLLASGLTDRDIHYRDPIWSPDGSRVAFIEVDTTHVRERAVLVPSDPSYPDVRQHRFARVAETLEKLRVGVVNSDGTQLRWLPIDAPEEGFYLGKLEWAGNSEEIVVETFSRFRNKREFLLVTWNGQAKTIYSEENEAWVESSQGKNSGLTWIQNGKSFIVISEKDGWRHAYLYTREGKEIACLTPGHFDIIDRAIVDEVRGRYYFYASPSDATQKYLYHVPLDGSSELIRLTPQDQVGTHHYLFSPNAKWAIHTFSTLDAPPLVELIELKGHRVVRSLEENLPIREKMKEINTLPSEFLKLDIGNGLNLDAWMIKPKGFDPTKKYPVFIYVYGEPHAQTVLNEWGTAQVDFNRLVAEMGYIVVSIDNRGTPAPKGAAWRRSVFGSLGPLSTEEQEAGLKELGRLFPFIDLSRVGIWGWSGGGSNTLNAMFRKPDTYHVGIAVVPKPQPHLYNAWFQEIYMQTREVNAEGYEKSAAINYADGLKGKLLIITGSGETNTHIQIIEGLIDRLVSLGKPFDYMVYPNRDHGLREGEGTSVHVRMLILRYLIENLPPGAR